jgi:hypothetical protein
LAQRSSLVSSQSWFGVGGIEPLPPNAAKENHTKGNVILKRGEFRCSLAKAPLAEAMSIGMKMLTAIQIPDKLLCANDLKSNI